MVNDLNQLSRGYAPPPRGAELGRERRNGHGPANDGNGHTAKASESALDRHHAYSPFEPMPTAVPGLDQHEYSKTPLTVCANEEVGAAEGGL